LQEVITRLGIDFDILSYTVDEFENDIDYITSRKVRKKVKELMGLEIFLLIDYLFSLLIFSDKLEAIYNSENMNIEEFIEKNTIGPGFHRIVLINSKKALK